VADDSDTETFLAARFHVDTWRWSGTPFYLRSGKRLPRRATEIAIVFKRPPVLLFGNRAGHARPNVLTLRIQPREGISLSIGSKLPGQDLRVEDVRMDFLYSTTFGGETPEAYERLLLDAVLGESTLFAREDEVDLAWGLVDPVAEAWRTAGDAPETYAAGTWGPACADELIGRDGRSWVRL
jgi:glucose-6-phosphate 1-dehydrogenase